MNKAGSIEKEKEGYIVITSDAADGLVLLSQGAGTEADAYVNENEAPEFAVDGRCFDEMVMQQELHLMKLPLI